MISFQKPLIVVIYLPSSTFLKNKRCPIRFLLFDLCFWTQVCRFEQISEIWRPHKWHLWMQKPRHSNTSESEEWWEHNVFHVFRRKTTTIFIKSFALEQDRISDCSTTKESADLLGFLDLFWKGNTTNFYLFWQFVMDDVLSSRSFEDKQTED